MPALAVPAVAVAAVAAAEPDPDPVYAVIDAHPEALLNRMRASRANFDAPDYDPQIKEKQAADDGAFAAEWVALYELPEVVPTTRPGFSPWPGFR